MTDVACQRWREHRASYRPSSEPIDPRLFEVAPIDETTAKAFVLGHHYASTFPAARYRVGLFTRGQLVGVCVFSEPMHPNVLRDLPGEKVERAELGRLVLLDDVGGNGESWFTARAGELALRDKGIASAVMFSDPIPRSTVDGVEVKKGHLGIVYQAMSAIYTGLANPSLLHLLPNGDVITKRAISKVRARERGAHGVIERLVAAGAVRDRVDDDPATWLTRELKRVCRRMTHPGNHRYLLGFAPSARRALRRKVERKEIASFGYPKGNLFGEAG
jgi:hypothetical protein